MHVFFYLGLDVYVTFLFPLSLPLPLLTGFALFHTILPSCSFGVTLSCFPKPHRHIVPLCKMLQQKLF